MASAPQWEVVQRKAFTRWINSHLRKRNRQVDDIIDDLKDGVALVNLYEIISEENFTKKYYAEPKNKFHKIANLNLVVDKINSFVGSVGIRVQFGAEQIFEGVKQQVLGMIWCLIHKFEIQDISEEELSAKEGLLLWCKKKTKGYKDVKVENFSTSWDDALAFAALLHVHRPDLLSFDEIHANKENRKDNLQKIFDIAEKELDIPQLLDAEDMVNYKPDDKAVMAQVAYYWKKFSSGQKSEKAARTIGMAAKKQKELEDLQHDYEKRANDLLSWIDQVTNSHSNPDAMKTEQNSLDKILKKSEQFKDFKNNQKPPRLTEKNDLEVLIRNICNKQRNEGLPVYSPPDHLSTASINAKWVTLDEVQELYDKTLSQHILLMKRLEILLGKFKTRSQKILDWQAKRKELMDSEEPRKIETLGALQSRVKAHDAFDEEVAPVEKNLQQLKESGTEIVSNKHESSEEVSTTMGELESKQVQVLESAKNLKDRLANELARREELVKICLEFARKAEQLNLFLEDSLMALSEPVRAESMKDIEIYQATVDSIEKEHQGTFGQVLNEMEQLDKKITEEEGNPKEFTQHELPDLTEKYNQVKEQLEAKKKELEQERLALLKELEDQQNDYEKRAKELIPWIEEITQKLSDPEAMKQECNNVEKVLKKNEEFKDFKNNQKPPRVNEKNDIEVLVKNICNKQANEGLPVYSPPDDLSTATINTKWDKLEETQELYDKTLYNHIVLMKRLEILLGKFKTRSQKILDWQAKRKELMDSEEPRKIETLGALQSRVKAHDAFDEEISSVEKNLQQLKESGTEIVSNKHESSEEVSTTMGELESKQVQVLESAKNLKDRLANELARREELVKICLEFARKAEQLNLFLEDSLLSLIEPVSAESVKDVEIYQATVDSIEKEHQGTFGQVLNEMEQLDKKITEEEGNPKEFTKHELPDLTEKYNQVKEQLEAKKKELEQESVVQQKNASLIDEFGQKIAAYTDWINKTKDNISSSVGEDKALEEQKQIVSKAGTQANEDSKTKLEELQSLYKQLEEADIAEKSPVTLQALEVLGQQIPAFVSKTLQNIEQQLIASKATNVTEEQIKEFRDVFDHFDKDHDSELTKLDFKACLSSLGEDIPDEELNKTFEQYDVNGDGKISFDEFIDFMIKINKESTDYDEVLASFQQIAGGNESVTEAQLRAVMDKESVDYLLERMPKASDNESYDYKSYLATTYGKN